MDDVSVFFLSKAVLMLILQTRLLKGLKNVQYTVMTYKPPANSGTLMSSHATLSPTTEVGNSNNVGNNLLKFQLSPRR